MRQYGISDVFISTFKALYHQSSSGVTEGGRNSSWFGVKGGMRQGYVMSGFILVLSWTGASGTLSIGDATYDESSHRF